MAYMNQDKKAKLAPAIKEVLKKYGMKGSLAVRNHSTLVLNIKSGKLNIIENYNNVRNNLPHGGPKHLAERGYLSPNPYHYGESFSGECKSFLVELFDAMNEGNHDRSDIMTDYFDVGWYVEVNVGQWNKPYQVI